MAVFTGLAEVSTHIHTSCSGKEKLEMLGFTARREPSTGLLELPFVLRTMLANATHMLLQMPACRGSGRKHSP